MSRIKSAVIGRTRRGRITRAVAAVILIPAVAFAAILMWTAGLTGTIGVRADGNQVWWTSVTLENGAATKTKPLYTPTVTGDGSGIKGTASLVGGTRGSNPSEVRRATELSLSITDAYPGTGAVVKSFAHTQESGLVLAGINAGTGVDVTVLKGTMVADTHRAIGCGDPISSHGILDEGNHSAIAFRLTVPEDASGDITLPSDAGLIAVPAGQYAEFDGSAYGCP